MPVFTDWKSLNSQHEIADLPSSIFSYRYGITIYVAFSAEAAMAAAQLVAALGGVVIAVPELGEQTIKEAWRIQILRGDDNEIVFDHAVTLKYDVIDLAFGTVGGTGLTFYTWNALDNESVITITVPSTPPALFGLAGGTSDPGGGGDYTSDYALIQLWWDSPVWEFDLEQGDRINVVFHNADLSNAETGAITSPYLGIQTRQFPVSGAYCYDPRAGETWVFWQKDQNLICSRSRRRGPFGLDEDQGIVGGGSPSYAAPVRIEPNLYCLLVRNHVLKLSVSIDEGLTWTETMALISNVDPFPNGYLQTPDGSTTYLLALATATVIDSNIPDDQAIHQGDTVVVTVKRDPSSAQWTASQAKCKGTLPPKTGFIGLTKTGTTFNALVHQDNTVRWFTSSDNLLTWAEVTA